MSALPHVEDDIGTVRSKAIPGQRIIAVDLDGTLIRSDLLVESVFLLLRYHPLLFVQALFWVLKGKAYFKRRIADAVTPIVETLPYNQPLIAWLEEQKKTGGARLYTGETIGNR